ncbi:DUF1217 domain-containing protein [Paenirhodobacter enshiensis]|uniref:DUF1217 domain-containing protein n=1 Tax=Paenirhodobacter enshiensis TaxID=1105367 RepID=UPI0035AE6386
MSYSVALPLGGYAGWKMLTQTMERQKAAFAESAQIQTTEAYFRKKIGSVTSAQDLVSDYRLLSVALGAFGLDEDIRSTYFIRKVLSEGTTDPKSFANKLTDKSYQALSAAFGFGPGETPRTSEPGFADTILKKFETRAFETAVGAQNDAMRIALNAERSLPEMAASGATNNTLWYQIIGSEPLSAYMQGALGLPDSIAALDVDRQLDIYKAKARAVFGSDAVAQLASGKTMDKMTRNYLIRDQIENGTTVANSPALQILQASRASGGTNILSLLL